MTDTSEDALLVDVARRAQRYLATLDARPVVPSPQAITRLGALDVPMPDYSNQAASVLAELDDFISTATMASAGRRFFGFVTGGVLPATLAANWLAGAWDHNAMLARVAPGVAFLEGLALLWLIDVLDCRRV